MIHKHRATAGRRATGPRHRDVHARDEQLPLLHRTGVPDPHRIPPGQRRRRTYRALADTSARRTRPGGRRTTHSSLAMTPRRGTFRRCHIVVPCQIHTFGELPETRSHRSDRRRGRCGSDRLHVDLYQNSHHVDRTELERAVERRSATSPDAVRRPVGDADRRDDPR